MRGTARRQIDREQRRAAANEKMGRELAWWILFGWPTIKTAVPPLATIAVGWWLWTNVDHDILTAVAGGTGSVAVLAYGLSWLWATGPSARMRSRVMGQRRHAAWHVTGAVGVVLLVGAYLLAGL